MCAKLRDRDQCSTFHPARAWRTGEAFAARSLKLRGIPGISLRMANALQVVQEIDAGPKGQLYSDERKAIATRCLVESRSPSSRHSYFKDAVFSASGDDGFQIGNVKRAQTCVSLRE